MTPTKKLYLFLACALVILGIYIVSLQIWGIIKLNDARARTAEENYRASKLVEKASALEKLAINFKKVKAEEEIIQNTLPDSKDSSKLIADLEALAQSSGLKITLIQSATAGKKTTGGADKSLLQTVKGKYSYELPLNLELSGSYESTLNFVEKIENYQRLLNITAVDISKREEGTGNIVIKMKITAYLMR